MNKYGECCYCGTALEAVWFVEYEYEYDGIRKTGRKRDNISHLECPLCGEREVIDDSFAGPWRYK